MKTKYFAYVSHFILILVLITASAPLADSAEYSAMMGVNTAKAVYDFRIGNPQVAAIHLNLIHSMISDPALTINGSKPDIVVVFIGPSVKIVSTDKSDFDQDQQKQIDNLAGLLAQMAKDGIKFEICMAAVHLMKVEPASILPMIQKVDNGWISVIGYQQKGYSLVSDF